MAVKSFNPTSPARRQMTVADFSEITAKEPEKKLLAARSNKGGRNSYGRITVRHQGGGNRTKIRLVDWKRRKDGMKAKVVAIEYDPNRTAQPGPDPVSRRHQSLHSRPRGPEDRHVR